MFLIEPQVSLKYTNELSVKEAYACQLFYALLGHLYNFLRNTYSFICKKDSFLKPFKVLLEI